KGGDVPGDVWRERRDGRGRLPRQAPVSIILDNRDFVPARERGDLLATLERQGGGRRIVDGGNAIERLRPLAPTDLRERGRIGPLGIHGHRNQANPELFGGGFQARIGEGRNAYGISR